MPRSLWIILGLVTAVVILITITTTQVVWAKTLSREEAYALWEDLLRQERYQVIEYSDPQKTTPSYIESTNDNRIEVKERRGAYLGGFFGMSNGGGWNLRGYLEAEVPVHEYFLQLYSKATIKWSPGFDLFLIESRYDRKKFPIWEFLLILRNAVHRQEIQILKLVPVPPQEVLQHPQFRFNPNDLSCPLGQRCPRGELRYDGERKVVVIQILGVRNPFSVEIPLNKILEPAHEGR